MGNWQLEVFKFSLYVFAPVMAFYVYHKVDFFKDDLVKFERKVNTPLLIANEKQFKEDLELLKKLRELSQKKKFAEQIHQEESK